MLMAAVMFSAFLTIGVSANGEAVAEVTADGVTVQYKIKRLRVPKRRHLFADFMRRPQGTRPTDQS